MFYPYRCQSCDHEFLLERQMIDAPDLTQDCPECGGVAGRTWKSLHLVTVGCSGGSDPDKVPEKFRVTQDALHGTTPKQAEKLERAYQEHLDEMRANKKPYGRITESIPAELFHGKIKETGDKKYWDDPKNRRRHKSVRI